MNARAWFYSQSFNGRIPAEVDEELADSCREDAQAEKRDNSHPLEENSNEENEA